MQQVTRGHNIVADGWAGASNPHTHPNPPPTLKHTQKVSKMLVSPLFNSMTASNGRMDKASYRVACPQLKSVVLTNAATERKFRRTFLYRNYGKQSEDRFQATLAVVGAAIAKVLTRTRKTKKGLI